jgi:SAM-dependent methyltransferase
MVSTVIHPRDDMFALDLATYQSSKRTILDPVAEATAYYLRSGALAVQLIDMARLIGEVEEPRRILDLPCGYGRVLRHLKEKFPDAGLFACELNKEAVEFCASEFGATPIYSTPEPREVKLPGEMDLVWVGSLLTHLSEEDSLHFLDVLNAALADNGVLAFTLHGRRHIANLERRAKERTHLGHMLDDLRGRGYAFRVREGRYGGSYCSPEWIAKAIARDGWRVLMWSESAWRGQDFVAVMKQPAS